MHSRSGFLKGQTAQSVLMAEVSFVMGVAPFSASAGYTALFKLSLCSPNLSCVRSGNSIGSERFGHQIAGPVVHGRFADGRSAAAVEDAGFGDDIVFFHGPDEIDLHFDGRDASAAEKTTPPCTTLLEFRSPVPYRTRTVATPKSAESTSMPMVDQ
jgi:hypothetical protein